MTLPANDPRSLDRMTQVIADTAEAHGVIMPEDVALAIARMALTEAMAIAGEILEARGPARNAATLLDGKPRP